MSGMSNEKQDEKVDEALENTFPASDAPAYGGKDVGPDKLANFDSVTKEAEEKRKKKS